MGISTNHKAVDIRRSLRTHFASNISSYLKTVAKFDVPKTSHHSFKLVFYGFDV